MGGVFFSEVASKLTLEELIYWTREPEELLALLKKPGLALIGDQSGIFSIPPQERKEVEKVIRLGGPFKKGIPPDWRRAFLYDGYEETSHVTGGWFPVHCNVLPSEIVELLGENGTIPKDVHFTPQQIRYLLKSQDFIEKTEGPLSFEVSNTFPIMSRKGNTIFFTVRWTPENKRSKKNQWDYFFPHAQFGDQKCIKKGTRLLLL